MELSGYDIDTKTILLYTTGKTAPLKRTFVDLQTWDRLLHKQSIPILRLPTRRFKKLMSFSWTRQDLLDGNHLELKKNVALCQEWIQIAFKRLSSEMQHEFLHEETYMKCQREKSERYAMNKSARMLGQYFSHITSIDQLLDAVFDLVIPLESTVFIEPSCGVGNFFNPLIQRGAMKILGYEIDTTIASIATAHASPFITVHTGDFLKSVKPSNGMNNVIVIGNPPFNGQNDDDDIILDFFNHCAMEWNANVIGFILPDRCTKPLYLERINSTLTSIYHCYHIASIPDSLFDFKGKQVRQPCSIMIYIHQSHHNSTSRDLQHHA